MGRGSDIRRTFGEKYEAKPNTEHTKNKKHKKVLKNNPINTKKQQKTIKTSKTRDGNGRHTQ